MLDCAGTRRGTAASAALAEAVMVAHRISGTFEREVPHTRLRDLLAEAARIAPAGDPVLAAQLAAAAPGTPGRRKPHPTPGWLRRRWPRHAGSTTRCWSAAP